MVWADMDDDIKDGEQLRGRFWAEAEKAAITREQFEQVVFVFAKDRLENWIGFLNTGSTNESEEGPRVKYSKEAATAAKTLAARCQRQGKEGNVPPLPLSLVWSCQNWQSLVKRMRG